MERRAAAGMVQRGGRTRQQSRQSVPHSRGVDKSREGYLRRDPSHKPDHPDNQASSARKINPYSFWL